MIWNKFFLLQSLFFVVLCSLGFISGNVFEVLWEKTSVNYELYLSLSSVYLFIILAVSRKKVSEQKPVKDFLFLGSSSKILLGLGYLFSIFLMGYFGLGNLYLTTNLYIPFANIFILLIIAYPFIFFEKKLIFYFLILLSILTLYLYETRIYIFFILILILVKVPKINILNSVFLIMLVLLLIFISSTRAETNLEFTTIMFLLNSFGAELRDGLFFYDIFTEKQLDLMRDGFFYNWITFIPGWSYLGVIDGDLLRSMQVPAQLVINLGLDVEGFNGVRTGMLWEAYILFGWSGVVTYSLFSALAINLSSRLYGNGFIFLSSLIAIGNLYSIVGFSYFVISNFGQLIVFYFIFFRGLASLLRIAKRRSVFPLNKAFN